MQRGPAFISELLSVIPNAHYYKRGTYDLKKVLVIPPSLSLFAFFPASFCKDGCERVIA